jgi:alpha-N-arabinofuranosidase
MNRVLLRSCVIAILSAAICSTGLGAQITVQADQPEAKISPTMYGIFFEDINFGADGGLYAELVKNRSFEFSDGMMGWTVIKPREADARFSIRDTAPLNAANPHYLRLEVKEPRDGYGVTNEGFSGMGIRKGSKYYFSLYARSLSGPVSLQAVVVTPAGRKLAEGRIEGIRQGWKNYHVLMTAADTEPKAQLNVLVTTPGTVDLDMISLFPEDSAGKSGTDLRPIPGLRRDLVEKLAELKPGFLRFPGGCIVEGRDIDNRYQWKNTIGDINQRKCIINRWNNEFHHRYTPDYFQSFGLGFYEFFTLSEDIGAEPMPILNCGMACQFNTGQLVPVDQLQPYIQDALDLIEFANGPADSTWGRKRAEMGHPKPFNMQLLGVGNEQWGPQYIERYIPFVKALKEKYPEVQLIGATGSDPTIFPNGPAEVKFLWGEMRRLNAEIVDEHFYRKPDWFLDSAGLYDNFERGGPKVFVGEYAAQSVGVASPDNRNNWHCAMAEAAFMTGMERNADAVIMTCYAPLFGQEQRWQWRPDLIWFDNLQSYNSANYYVQQLFSLNRPDVVLPAEVTGQAPPTSRQPGLYVVAGRDEKAKEIVLKAVNSAAEPTDAAIQVSGGRLTGTGTVTILMGALADENSLENPRKVAPITSPFRWIGRNLAYTFQPYSLTVLRLSENR